MTIEHFWSMGGYGAYVWPAYGLTVFTLSVLPILAFLGKRKILKMIRGQHASTS